MSVELANIVNREMVDNYRISAIIPAYNSAEHLPRATASVRAQESPVAEIIVVDDGSTDGTFDIAAGLGPPVRVVRQENAGAERYCLTVWRLHPLL